MAFVKEEGICPICKRNAVITRKWVVNKYKKKYFYTIYHHDKSLHYLNQASEHRRNLKKGQLEKILIEKIISEKFKTGLFGISDIRNLLSKEYPDIDTNSIRSNLYRLSGLGILESVKKGKGLYFLNAVYKERLGFVYKSIRINLEDVRNDGTFERHIFSCSIKNDKGWPLYFLPWRILGDADIEFKRMEFKATDTTDSEEVNTLVIEDKPREKRLLLKLNEPLFPGDVREIKFKYNWPEPKQSYIFSAATNTNSLYFSLSSRSHVKVVATLTLSTLNEVEDLSGEIMESKSKKWKYIYSIHRGPILPFSVFQIKWKPS